MQTTLAVGVMGSFSFVFEQQPPAGDRLNLGAWHGQSGGRVESRVHTARGTGRGDEERCILIIVTTYDSATALIVVDMQNDFADPGGSLYVAGGEELVAAVNDEIARARDAGALVVYTQDWHPSSTPHFQTDGGIWPVHCVAESWGAALHPELEVAGPAIKKGVGGEDGYSGFTVRDPKTGETASTGLAELLAGHGIERVIVVGLALDYCVKATALDAATAGFTTTVLATATRPVELESGDGDRAVAELRSAGVRVASTRTPTGGARDPTAVR